MKTKDLFLSAFFATTTGLFLASCDSNRNDSNSETTTNDAINMSDSYPEGERPAGEYNGDLATNPENSNWYTYGYVDEGTGSEKNMGTNDKSAQNERSYTNVSPKEGKAVKTSATGNRPAVKAEPVVYTISDTDRPPLFSQECLTAENPQQCSNEALEKWFRKNAEYPEADLLENNEGLTYVTFVINKEGKISTVQRVVNKEEACEDCGKAAVDAVTAMPAWTPAMRKGKPVSVKVTLPVRFRTL